MKGIKKTKVMIAVLKKKITAALAVMAGIFALAGCDEERRINSDRLPEEARAFISQYFPGKDIIYAEKDRDDRTVSYTVRLSDGAEIDFDEDGGWTSVDCNLSPIPEGIVPQAIYDHLETYVPGGTDIFKAERMWGGYEITIRDGRDLIYDADGAFVREDR